ncbi:hypothetical protein RHSIM_Rhsim01G0132400 [Rhododendron simsii]|uniref:Uncharacterized protein n=1 Tax=Rhododendron simsii TaxID=118357 RepID=A0A834HCK4_RHOSS|nr:hypothetical protein RHSIM_Rhsim01G0132400 [Rhododendron simsii]
MCGTLYCLMFSDLGKTPIFKQTLERAKNIAVFLYRHQRVIDLFRKFTKKTELTRLTVTWFATAYLTIKSFDETKMGLRYMFASKEWFTSPYSKSVGGMKPQGTCLHDKKFWKTDKYCMKVVLPLVKFLRLVDGDAKPVFGYVYEAMARAKEEIANNVKNVKERYTNIWNIIDMRWDLQLCRPIHAAAFFLNPNKQSKKKVDDFLVDEDVIEVIEDDEEDEEELQEGNMVESDDDDEDDDEELDIGGDE